MSFLRLMQAALVVFVSLPLAIPAQAKLSWAVADRTDEKIEA